MASGIKIFWNCASILTGNFLNKIISIVVLIYLTGYLSPAEFGRYSFAISYIAFFGIFTDMGLNTLITREISGGSIDASLGFGHAIIIRFILSVSTAAVSILSLYAMGYPVEVLGITAAASLSLFLSFRGLFFRTVFDVPFQVNLKMSYPSAINFLNEILTFGLIVLLIKQNVSLLGLVLAINLVNIPGFVAIIYFSSKVIRPRFSIDLTMWKKIFTEALPLGGAVLLEGIFIIIPIFILSRLATEEALGLYSLPFRLVSSLWIIPVALMISLFPKISRDALRSEDLVKEGFLKGLKMVLLIGVPIAVLTDYYSSNIIDTFTRGRYMGSAPALSLMIWGTLIYFVNTVFFYIFTAAGRQKMNTIVWCVVSGVSVMLCALLIPGQLHMGAAMGFVGSLGAGLLLNIFLGYRVLGINVVPVLSKFLLSGLLTLTVLFFLPFLPEVSVILSLSAYLSILFFIRAVSIKEWGEWLNGK
ncbi:MAG: flippase [Deltaproteobacteria bacterium]|nr:flippase [Deltaproteobacteria bacterium]